MGQGQPSNSGGPGRWYSAGDFDELLLAWVYPQTEDVDLEVPSPDDVVPIRLGAPTDGPAGPTWPDAVSALLADAAGVIVDFASGSTLAEFAASLRGRGFTGAIVSSTMRVVVGADPPRLATLGVAIHPSMFMEPELRVGWDGPDGYVWLAEILAGVRAR